MKAFQIFKPGKHTASDGRVIEFTAEMLQAAVAAYDPALHEAPIVVGHPKDNGPAYGWVKSLAFDESGAVVVEPQQLETTFEEMVDAGRFKKRSASWYMPDSPVNPKPGTLYLRHVGFLGATAPAIKGLKDVEFSDGEGVVEFVENARFAWASVNVMLRGLREWIIGKDGLEAADKVLPNFYLSDIEAASRQSDDTQIAGMPAYSEDPDMKTIEQLQAEVAAQAATIATLQANQKPANFGEQEASLQAREAAVATAEAAAQRVTISNRVDAIVKAGRMVPAQKAAAVSFAMGLADKDASIDFGEGDKAKKVTQREAYLLQLESSPKVVDYKELAPNDGAPGDVAMDPVKASQKARDLVKAAAEKGRTISFTEAVAEVMKSDAAA